MPGSSPCRVLRLAAAAALLSSLGGAARGAGLEISPTLVRLSPGETSAIVQLRNGGAEEVRYQVQLTRWGESPEGEMQLAPTQDVIVFPALLALKPGEERNLRVGAAVGFGPVEKSYRLFLEELPPAQRPGAAAQVRVLSRIGIPIFLAPSRAEERPEIEDLLVSGGRVAFALRNRGTVHYRPAELRVSGLDASGAELFRWSFNPWYVLAGGERRYEHVIPAASCARVRKVTVESSAGGGVLVASRVTPDGACAR
ncbi:MAG TPA: fimbria/pilus periplasmic chaperone [Anaeromyxobacteraceae bacterium]|jgi:fimbrial chaperone protein|nr:fimbria/pilus periplasmic chaperone [Anaeromyxobacteraceae bacterium]